MNNKEACYAGFFTGSGINDIIEKKVGDHMKKRIALLIAAIICICCIFTCAKSTVKADETLKATNVRVEIDVSEFNILTIKETIDIFFETPHHGIIRNIPLNNTIINEDGSTDYKEAEVYDFNCNHPFSTYVSGDYTVRIGDPDKEVTGAVQYVLTYKYDLGNDRLKDKDELYINIIGNGWDYDIERLEVAIHMPKEFDASKLGVSHGKWGTVDYSGVQQRIEDKSIFLVYDQTLEPGDAFTVRLELPDKYFKKEFNLTRFLTGLFGVLIAFVTGLLNTLTYNRFGKPDPVITPVEFYPPENMSPPRLANILYNYPSDRSVNGLLITLASKGYLTIEVPEKDKYRFIIYDKDTSELCEEEAMYYDGLWEKGIQQEDGTRIVEKEDLEYKFYSTIARIKDRVYKTSERVYVKGQKVFATLSIISSLALILVVPLIMVINVPLWRFEWYHWAAMALCFITGGYLFVLGFKYKKRTKRNNELYGRALGFRDFIDVADKDRIEALVEENPAYFYDILPYAYALGLTDRWMKKFEGMLREPASWYRGDDFDYFMYSTMTDYSYDASSVHYESSSDDFDTSSGGWSSSSDSGGGFSGGGSGGGGSSGW